MWDAKKAESFNKISHKVMVGSRIESKKRKKDWTWRNRLEDGLEHSHHGSSMHSPDLQECLSVIWMSAIGALLLLNTKWNGWNDRRVIDKKFSGHNLYETWWKRGRKTEASPLPFVLFSLFSSPLFLFLSFLRRHERRGYRPKPRTPCGIPNHVCGFGNRRTRFTNKKKEGRGHEISAPSPPFYFSRDFHKIGGGGNGHKQRGGNPF